MPLPSISTQVDRREVVGREVRRADATIGSVDRERHQVRRGDEPRAAAALLQQEVPARVDEGGEEDQAQREGRHGFMSRRRSRYCGSSGSTAPRRSRPSIITTPASSVKSPARMRLHHVLDGHAADLGDLAILVGGLEVLGQPQVVHEEDLAVQPLGHRILDAHRAHAIQAPRGATARCPLPPTLPCAASRRRVDARRRCARPRGCRACRDRRLVGAAARDPRVREALPAREAVQVRAVGHEAEVARGRALDAEELGLAVVRRDAHQLVAPAAHRRRRARARGSPRPWRRCGPGAYPAGWRGARRRRSPRRRGASGAAGRRTRARSHPIDVLLHVERQRPGARCPTCEAWVQAARTKPRRSAYRRGSHGSQSIIRLNPHCP